MSAAQDTVLQKYEPIIMAQFRTATFMAKQNISDKKFGSLIDLQVELKSYIYFNTEHIYNWISGLELCIYV